MRVKLWEKSLKIKKGAPNICQILSYLNKILTFMCYYIDWQLGRILEKQGIPYPMCRLG